jgi:hypothetical protein
MSTSVPCEEWGRKGRLWTPSLAESGAMSPVYTVINLDTCNRLPCRSAGRGPDRQMPTGRILSMIKRALARPGWWVQRWVMACPQYNNVIKSNTYIELAAEKEAAAKVAGGED